MSNNDKQLPALSEADQAGAPRQRLWPIWVLLILLVLIVGALAFGLWDQYRQQQFLASQYEQLSESTQQLRNDQSALMQSREQPLNQLRQRLEKQSETLAEQREKLTTQARQIEHNARTLLGLGKRTRTDWLLAEAEYLLRLANQRLRMEGDHRGALKLLQDADSILAETDDAGVYPVRQQLAREILALKTLDPIDRTGLYLQLEAAMGMASELGSEQLFGMRRMLDQPEGSDDLSSAPEGWRGVWQRVKQTLGEMVVIRRLEAPNRALLSPEQNVQARLHLQLMFEQAAVALLQENQSTYRRALRRADEWLAKWYNPDSTRVTTLQQLIDDMSDEQITLELPDISESLSLLKARVDGRLDEGASGDDSANTTEEPES